MRSVRPSINPKRQKNQLGMRPNKKKLDRFHEQKNRSSGDKHLLLSKIITKNHELRLKGNHDRALGIELMIEKFFDRNSISIRTCSADGVYESWSGQIFQKPIELTKKVEILAMLLNLENLDKIKHNCTLQRKDEIVSLPRTLSTLNELISKRNLKEGSVLMLNRNRFNLSSLTSNSLQTGTNTPNSNQSHLKAFLHSPEPTTAASISTPDSEANLHKNSLLQLEKGPILHSSGFDEASHLLKGGSKMRVSENVIKNFFDLEKGPLLSNSRSFSQKTANSIVVSVDPKFETFDFGDFDGENGQRRPKKSGFDLLMELQGIQERETDNRFLELGGSSGAGLGGQGDKMRAFQHQGYGFMLDPYKFKPQLPISFKPFSFDRSGFQFRKTELEVIGDATETQRGSFLTSGGLSKGGLAQSLIFGPEANRISLAPPNSKEGLPASFGGFGGSRNNGFSLFLGSGQNRDSRTTADSSRLGGTIGQLSLPRPSILANGGFGQGGGGPEQEEEKEVSFLQEFINNTRNYQDRVKPPNFWEDLDSGISSITAQSLRSDGGSESFCGLTSAQNLITKRRCERLQNQLHHSLSSLFSYNFVDMEQEFLRKNLDLALMGVEGDLFILDKENGQFFLRNPDKKLPTVSNRTLNNLLEDFLEPATKLYKLTTLNKCFALDAVQESFTNKSLKAILDEYLQFVHQTILNIPQNCTILQYHYELKDLFTEMDLVYRIFFDGRDFSTNLTETYKPSTDSENLDFIYNMLQALHRSGDCVDIVNYIMEESLRPIIQTLNYIVFVEPDSTKLHTNLKMSISKNEEYDFICMNVPNILRKCILNVLLTAQNLTMLRSSDPDVYNVFVGWSCKLELLFTRKDASLYLMRAQLAFDGVVEKLKDLMTRREIEENEKMLQGLRDRLFKLQTLKMRVEQEKEQKQRIKQMEIFKRAQLQSYLQSQIIEGRVKKAMELELEKEFEKSLLIDAELRAKKQERDKILEEIRKLGSNIDAEIDDIILENERKSELEKLEVGGVSGGVGDGIEGVEGDGGVDELGDVDLNEFERSKRIYKRYEVSQVFEGGDLAEIEETGSGDANEARDGQEVNQILEEQPENDSEPKLGSSGAMVIEDESGQNTQENGPGEHQGSINNPASTSSKSNITSKPEKKNLANKHSKKALMRKLKDKDYDINLKDIKNSNRMFKLPEKLNKWMDHKKKREKILESNKSLLESLAFGALDPPLSVMFNLCIDKVIARQAELTNSIVLQLIYEKYKLLDVLYHFKNIFMCGRGDYALEYMDWVYNERGEVDRFHVRSLGTVFENFADEKLPDVRFKFEIGGGRKRSRRPVVFHSIVKTQLEKIVQIRSELKPPLSYLLSDQVCAVYFQLFNFFVKVRYHQSILNKLWKFIKDDLPKSGIPHTLCKKLLYIRFKTDNFCSLYLEYLYHVVIEGCWKQFLSRLGTSKTFNNIFRHHASYLSKIAKMSFSHEKNEGFFEGIHNWMSAINDFEILCRSISYGEYDDLELGEIEEKISEMGRELEKYESYFGLIIPKFISKQDKSHLFNMNKVEQLF